jgi:hypothetical protein
MPGSVDDPLEMQSTWGNSQALDLVGQPEELPTPVDESLEEFALGEDELVDEEAATPDGSATLGADELVDEDTTASHAAPALAEQPVEEGPETEESAETTLPGEDDLLEPSDTDTSAAMETLREAVQAGDVAAARTALAALSPVELNVARNNIALLAEISESLTLREAVGLYDSMGLDAVQLLFSLGRELLLRAAQVADPALQTLLARHPAGPAALVGVIPNALLSDLFVLWGVPIADRLKAAGLPGGAPVWDLFMHVVSALPKDERQVALLDVRTTGMWSAMLASLDASHVALVQGWLAEDGGDTSGLTLEQRIEGAKNSDRAKVALAVVDLMSILDANERITPRIRELLVLGVALPKLDTEELSSEGVLSVNQVQRAALALINMPDQEYLRTAMLLELSGDPSRLTQSFLLLEAVAARADSFGVQGAPTGDLGQIESFADDIREMDQATLVDQTSTTQTSAADATGMTQKFSDSCGPTAAQVVRAEADPVEALKMNQKGELDVGALDSDAAREQESSLERYGYATGSKQAAVPRTRAAVIAVVTGTMVPAGLTAVERKAVLDYMNGLSYDAALYGQALPKIKTEMGANFPGDDALRMVRESAGRTGEGLKPDDLVTEGNGALGVDDVTGQQWTSQFDSTLFQLFSNAGRSVTAANMTAWASRVRQLLDSAAPRLAMGDDVVFIVYWEVKGGHFMTFTNVRENGGVREFLVHDPWIGQTSWVSQTDILAGNWPGGKALICGLQS